MSHSVAEIMPQVEPGPSRVSSLGARVGAQIALVLGASVLLTAAVTRQSLWIDEAYVAWFGSLPSYHTMLSILWA